MSSPCRILGKEVTLPWLMEFSRYFGISLVALIIDLAILHVLAQFMHYLIAASLGFMTGAAVSYFLATRWAFTRRRLVERPRAEFNYYVLIGLVGLSVNDLVMYLAVGMYGASLFLGKMAAAMTSFLFGYAGRKWILF